jgi:hypothetical protein
MISSASSLGFLVGLRDAVDIPFLSLPKSHAEERTLNYGYRLFG